MKKENLLSFVYKVRNDILDLGAKMLPVDGIEFQKRWVMTMGKCLCYRKRDPFCVIRFSENLLKLSDQSIHEIVAHELLHSVKGTKGHDKKFMSYAKKMNEKYGLHIQAYISDETIEDIAAHGLYKYIVECRSCGSKVGYLQKANVVKALLDGKKASGYSCPCCGKRVLKLAERGGKNG